MDEGTKKYCKHCGELIDQDCVVCPKCGKQVEDLKQNNNGQGNIVINNSSSSSASAGSYGEMVSPKSWLTTLLLCIFIGGLGIHRFYVGKIGTGILMIPLMFIGVGEVWLVVDLIMIILGRFSDKQGRPIKR